MQTLGYILFTYSSPIAPLSYTSEKCTDKCVYIRYNNYYNIYSYFTYMLLSSYDWQQNWIALLQCLFIYQISLYLDPLCNPHRFLPSLTNSAGHVTESTAITRMVVTEHTVTANIPIPVAPSASLTLMSLIWDSPGKWNSVVYVTYSSYMATVSDIHAIQNMWVWPCRWVDEKSPVLLQ